MCRNAIDVKDRLENTFNRSLVISCPIFFSVRVPKYERPKLVWQAPGTPAPVFKHGYDIVAENPSLLKAKKVRYTIAGQRMQKPMRPRNLTQSDCEDNRRRNHFAFQRGKETGRRRHLIGIPVNPFAN
jgi:hypothetical protein